MVSPNYILHLNITALYIPQFDPVRPGLLVSISPRFNTLSKCNYVSRPYTHYFITLPTTRPFKYRDLYPTSKLVELEPIEIWNTVVWGSILGESVFLTTCSSLGDIVVGRKTLAR